MTVFYTNLDFWVRRYGAGGVARIPHLDGLESISCTHSKAHSADERGNCQNNDAVNKKYS